MRSRFLLKAIALCAVVSSAVFAQTSTARIDALSGTLIYKDPYLMLNDPVEMFYYEDIIQASYGSSVVTSNNVGPIFATRRLKSAENFMIGLIANRNDNAWRAFYDTSSSELSFSGGGSGLDQMPNVPHLLLGLDLDFMTIGLDINYEFARGTTKTEDTDSTVAFGRFETITETTDKIGTPGVKLSSDILLGDDLKLGIGAEFALPRAKSFSSTEQTFFDAGDGALSSSLIENTTEVDKGIRLKGFADVATEIADVTWKIGAGVAYDRYKFVRTEESQFDTSGGGSSSSDTTVTGEFPTFRRTNPYAWLGGLKEIQPGLVGGFSYRFSADLQETTPDSIGYTPNTRIIQTRALTNQIRGGIEKTWEECWRFDQVFARAGLQYDVTTEIDRQTSDGDQGARSYETRTKDPTTFSEMDITLGSGIRKGVFLFDFVVKKDLFSNIIPVITGANSGDGSFLKFTITLDFKHRTADCCPKPCEGGSSMMRSTPASTPSYGGEEQTEEPDMDFSF